jgi:hypothetical protein
MLKCTSVVFAILPLRILIVPWMTGLCVVVDRAEEHASRESLLQPDMNFSELRLPCFRSFSRLAASGKCATPLPTAEWIWCVNKKQEAIVANGGRSLRAANAMHRLALRRAEPSARGPKVQVVPHSL